MDLNVLNLPVAIKDLVQQYSDEKVYTETMNSSNPLARKEILDLELQNIPISCITRFKLAMQLAEYYKDKLNLLYKRINRNNSSALPDKNISNRNPDVETIFPAFYFYLEYYSYDQLLDLDSEMIDRGSIQLIEDLIERATKNTINQLYEDMFKVINADTIDELNPEIRDFATQVRKIDNLSLNKLNNSYFAFQGGNPKVTTTLSWRRYQKEFLEYLKLSEPSKPKEFNGLNIMFH